MPENINSFTSSGFASDLRLSEESNQLNSLITPGLIHEMNNVLTGIYFNLETMRDLFDSKHPASEALNEVNQGFERIKELLARTAQIHLNTVESEQNYHDLESLASSQLDLLRILFPRTFRVSITAPNRATHVHVAEFPFRVALLIVALFAKSIALEGKSEIFISIHSSEALEALAPGYRPAHAAVGISFPCHTSSLAEIEEPHDPTAPHRSPLARATNIMRTLGGDLRSVQKQGTNRFEVLLVLQEVEINH